MLRIKIAPNPALPADLTSHGQTFGIEVTNAETGEPLTYVKRMFIDCDADKPFALAFLEEIALDNDGKPKVRYGDPAPRLETTIQEAGVTELDIVVHDECPFGKSCRVRLSPGPRSNQFYAKCETHSFGSRWSRKFIGEMSAALLEVYE